MPVNQSFPPRGDRSADDRLFLREEELAHGVHMLLAIATGLSALVREPARKAGLTETQLNVMVAIASSPGISVTRLRSRLGLPTPTLARVLAELDEAGHVDRSRKGVSDSRRKQVVLTPGGAALVDRLYETARQLLKRAYKDAGPTDVAGTRRVLGALKQIVEDETEGKPA